MPKATPTHCLNCDHEFSEEVLESEETPGLCEECVEDQQDDDDPESFEDSDIDDEIFDEDGELY